MILVHILDFQAQRAEYEREMEELNIQIQQEAYISRALGLSSYANKPNQDLPKTKPSNPHAAIGKHHKKPGLSSSAKTSQTKRNITNYTHGLKSNINRTHALSSGSLHGGGNLTQRSLDSSCSSVEDSSKYKSGL